jgi:hypothetical protein
MIALLKRVADASSIDQGSTLKEWFPGNEESGFGESKSI